MGSLPSLVGKEADTLTGVSNRKKIWRDALPAGRAAGKCDAILLGKRRDRVLALESGRIMGQVARCQVPPAHGQALSSSVFR